MCQGLGHKKLVEAAEAVSIYNCLKCIWKAKSAQKVTVKVTAESAGFGWMVLDETELWLRRSIRVHVLV